MLDNGNFCEYESSLTGAKGNKLSVGTSYLVKVSIGLDNSKSSIYVRQEYQVIQDGLRTVPATG